MPAMDKAAEQGVSTLMPGVFDYLSKICEATGNVVDAAGRPLTHELILSALEKVEIDFDVNDEPIMPTLVVHPEMAEKLSKLPPPTPAQDAAFRALMERKRGDYRARRPPRQLS